jgi:hypothetical protein
VELHRERNGMFSFGISLSLKTRGRDRLEFCIPLRSRLLFAFFFVLSCFVFLSSTLSEDKPGSYTIPLVLVCVTGLSALYEERWIFDKNRNIFESRFGLLIFSRKKRSALSELARVELDSFTKGHIGETRGTLEDEQTPNSPQPSDKAHVHSLLKAPQRRYIYRIIRLRVVDKQEKAYVLDSTRAHRIEAFRLNGLRIADFCSIPFREM